MYNSKEKYEISTYRILKIDLFTGAKWGSEKMTIVDEGRDGGKLQILRLRYFWGSCSCARDIVVCKRSAMHLLENLWLPGSRLD